MTCSVPFLRLKFLLLPQIINTLVHSKGWIDHLSLALKVVYSAQNKLPVVEESNSQKGEKIIIMSSDLYRLRARLQVDL